jgi:hypothetical protein
VYFDLKDTNLLQQSVKENLLWNVSRKSSDDKINDFMLRSLAVAGRMRYMRKMNSHPISRFFSLNEHRFSNLVMLVTVVINCMIIFSWDAFPDVDNPKPDTFSNYTTVLRILGIFHVFCSILLVTSFYVNNPLKPPISKRDIMIKICDVMRKLGRYMPLSFQVPDQKENNITDPEVPRISLLSRIPLYYMVFLALSVFGLFNNGYTYGFHLLHVVFNNDILGRVIQAVTRNGLSLIYVAALLVIIVYLYAISSFVLTRNSFVQSEGQFCDNLWQCFLISLSFGLRTGTIGAPNGFGFLYFSLRALFDVSFFIIVNIIGLNVVFGIIVDTFQELHDEKTAIKENMETECFICSRMAYDFEQAGVGFNFHVKKEHNMWNYLFYFVYLSLKDPNEMTSHESFVFEMLKANDNSFFPVGHALSLEAKADEAEDQLDAIQSGLQYLDDRLKREEALNSGADGAQK